MTNIVFYTPADCAALVWAADELRRNGFAVADDPSAKVTHLLLGAPCKTEGEELAKLLAKLPQNITVLGGKLSCPQLTKYKTIDLLQDETYLWQNARITAQVALTLGAKALDSTLDGLEILILGWGRIGQCLAPLLKSLGAEVTVAARKDVHRAQIQALGYRPANSNQLGGEIRTAQLIYNTVPYPILESGRCASSCVKIDLASKDGIIGSDVLVARGLPGKYAPRSSGRLMGQTAARLAERWAEE